MNDLPQMGNNEAVELVKQITESELLCALRECGNTDTSPGPDGIPYALYRSF